MTVVKYSAIPAPLLSDRGIAISLRQAWIIVPFTRLVPIMQEEVVVQKDNDSAPRPSKRRKRLDLKKLKKLDLEGKVETIVNY